MDMWVELHVSLPGVKDTDDGRFASKETLVSKQRLQRVRAASKQHRVNEHGRHSSQGTQERRQRKGDHEIRRWQKALRLLFEPLGALLVLAGGAMAVAAGMIAVTDLVAMRTVIYLPAQGLGSASLDIAHGLALLGRQREAVLLLEIRSEPAKDFLNRAHRRSLITFSRQARAFSVPVRVRCV